MFDRVNETLILDSYKGHYSNLIRIFLFIAITYFVYPDISHLTIEIHSVSILFHFIHDFIISPF